MFFESSSDYGKLQTNQYMLFTAFQQKMLKSAFLIFLSLFLIVSCASFSHKKVENQKEVKVGMTQAEVKKVLGEPTVISKTQEGTIIWSYRPSWKLIPDNRGTVMVEFRENRVIKVIRAR